MAKIVPVHWLSKEARFRIIDVMLSTRTANSLAEELGITRTAIRKYISREMHPSDEVMEKIFMIAAPYEEDRLLSIAVEDLVEALKRLYESLKDTKYRDYLRDKLREVLESIEKQ